jgi:hypothetical protein
MSETTLPPVLAAASEEFRLWAHKLLLAEQETIKITEPLYHYINAAGMRGILESQKVWFTSYPHLNDPSELVYGMEIVHRLLREMSRKADDGLVHMFCEMVDDLFRPNNFKDTFGFYIASLSRARNDLAQWRAYADNGRGFAIGLAPHLFEAVENLNPQPTEYIVMPVVYGEENAVRRYSLAIEAAAAIVKANRPHLADKAVGIPFLREMANRLISSQLIGVSLGTKHGAYSHEQEVRLVMIGTTETQKPHVKTRIRGAEIVPFIEGDMPLRNNGGIVEIVVGPAAGPTATDSVQKLLESFGVEVENRIQESGIPYRVF